MIRQGRLIFQVDVWSNLRPIIMPLWERHNLEVASLSDQKLFAPDWDKFDNLAATGNDHWVSARDGGALVGYAFALVSTHLHRKNTLCAFWDLYYLVPELRVGMNGYNLLKFFESSLWQRGVRKQYTGTKKWMDVGSIFERRGWTEVERLFTKSLD